MLLCGHVLFFLSITRFVWLFLVPNPCDKQLNCNLFLFTATAGHLLRLDFRDEFHIEPSDACKFDYLEVRDGAHGYENLIGKFCGREFPPMMTSSGRFLWLRFHSDENIEYKGFSAVYESIPKPTSGGSSWLIYYLFLNQLYSLFTYRINQN